MESLLSISLGMERASLRGYIRFVPSYIPQTPHSASACEATFRPVRQRTRPERRTRGCRGAHHQDAKRVGGLFCGPIVLMAARDVRHPLDSAVRSRRAIVLSFRPAVVARRVAVASVFGSGRAPALWRTAWRFTVQREPSAGWRAQYRGRVAKTALSRISRGCGVTATDMRR